MAHTFKLINGVRVRNPPPVAPSSCVHRGAEIRLTECGTCAGRVRLKVFGCAVHGECTEARRAEGVRGLCAGCKDHVGRPALQVESRSGGIGDHLLALAIAQGLQKQHPAADVFFCGPGRTEWTSLFWPRVVTTPIAAPTCFCDVDRKGEFDARRMSRVQFWGEQFGVTPMLPERRPLPAAAAEWAIPYSGRIVLAPFSAWADRTWPLDRWLELEKLLLANGFQCVVLDDHHDRAGAFQSPKLLCETPARVCAAIAAGACLIGNDSGMVHVAGLLRAPAVAVVHPHSDVGIVGLHPTVRAIHAGGLTPAALTALALGAVRTGVDPEFPADAFAGILPEEDRWRLPAWTPMYAALWRTVRELAPRRIVEIGVRAGASAWTMLDACPEAVVHGIEIEGADDGRANETGGTIGGGSHAEKILAGRAFTLQRADSRMLERIPPCDLCYIDGDHSEAGCWSDLLLAERSGAAALLVDDYANRDGVRAAVARFLRDHPERRGRFIASETGLYLIR